MSALGVSELTTSHIPKEKTIPPASKSNITEPQDVNLTFGKHDRPGLVRNTTVALESVDDLFDL